MSKESEKGQIILVVIVIASIGVYLFTGFVSWSAVNIQASRRSANRELAFQIAEAGVDYYRWHLAHAPTDYQDGTGEEGPYVHDFEDKDGNVIGQFSLDITPPLSGSTIVTIESTGEVTTPPIISRTIRTRLAIPSIASYSVVANDEIRFGEGTEVYGPIHSNYGIRFDGLAHNIVSSSQEEYDDPDHSGSDEFGVHTHVSPIDPLPPAAIPARPDVFEAGRLVGVPQVDFTGITADLAEIKADAQTDGVYLPNSGALGYRILAKTDDTFDVYRVDSLVPIPSGCTLITSQPGWGTWSVQNETFLQNYALPNNDLVFVEDNLWVEGQVDTARITIASGRFPSNPADYTSITINNDLLYSNYDGQDVIGLISQGNINAGLVSEDDLRIDAALIAQNGRIGRYYYRPPSGGSDRCEPYHTRDTITLYGMLATYERYGFAYTDGTGYTNRNITYDANLFYGPPPNFPLTSDQYVTISWEDL